MIFDVVLENILQLRPNGFFVTKTKVRIGLPPYHAPRINKSQIIRYRSWTKHVLFYFYSEKHINIIQFLQKKIFMYIIFL